MVTLIQRKWRNVHHERNERENGQKEDCAADEFGVPVESTFEILETGFQLELIENGQKDVGENESHLKRIKLVYLLGCWNRQRNSPTIIRVVKHEIHIWMP